MVGKAVSRLAPQRSDAVTLQDFEGVGNGCPSTLRPVSNPVVCADGETQLREPHLFRCETPTARSSPTR